jgi:TonB family protein
MKLVFLCGLLNMFTAFVSYSQVIGKFYYNEHWELTHQKSVVFFRVCVFDTVNNQFAGEVRDYTKDGRLLMTGTYKEGSRNGVFTHYYPNGQVESHGDFINNQTAGLWKYYYPDGSPKQEATFTDREFMLHFFYDSTNTKVLENGTGFWYDVSEEYKLPSRIIIRGNFLNGKKNGDWECLLENGDYIYKEKFKSGEFKKGYLTDSRGNRRSDNHTEFLNKLLPHFRHDVMERFEREPTVTQQDYPYLKFLRKAPAAWCETCPSNKISSDTLISGTEIFLIVEESAYPVGGMPKFYEHIAHQLRYPAEARKMGIEGKVFVEFVINQDGSISDVRAIKGIGGGCDEEAVRVIAAAPHWNPGTQKGEPVRQRFVMPVIFQLGRAYFRK